MSRPTLAVVIPAYNEADSIGWLLSSLRSELDELTEIIVVDNNSTDNTAAIARSFCTEIPQLRVLTESRRGVIAARNAGFDAVSCDIIGRLDADTRAKPGWAAAIRDFFASAGESVGAGSGNFDQYDMPLQGIHRRMVQVANKHAENNGGDVPSLFGANMAIRRSTWEKIRLNLLEQDGIFDDLDITLCVKEIDKRCVFIPGMEISASGRRMLSSISVYRKFTAYMPATFEARGMPTEARRAKANATTMRLLHLVFWIPARAWDPAHSRYSLRQLFSQHKQRVLPYGAPAVQNIAEVESSVEAPAPAASASLQDARHASRPTNA